MSWHREFVAKDKAAARQEIARYQTQQGEHFPDIAAASVVSAIDFLPDGKAVYVKTNGHRYTHHAPGESSGNSELVVRSMDIVTAD